MIDSLTLFESLKTANLSDPQARAIAQAIGKAFDDNETRQTNVLAGKVDSAKLNSEVHQLETSLKQDIASFGVGIRAELKESLALLRSEIRDEIALLRAEFSGEISQLGSELKSEIAQLRSDTKSDIAQLEAKIAESKSAMIRWMFIFWIGQVAAMKFLR